jgi:hypothetical protein
MFQASRLAIGVGRSNTLECPAVSMFDIVDRNAASPPPSGPAAKPLAPKCLVSGRP